MVPSPLVFMAPRTSALWVVVISTPKALSPTVSSRTVPVGVGGGKSCFDALVGQQGMRRTFHRGAACSFNVELAQHFHPPVALLFGCL